MIAKSFDYKRPLLLIMALAAALRFYGLGSESLFMDEAVTAERLQIQGYWGLLTDWDSWTQGPLFYLLNESWCDWFGFSESMLRFPAAVYGTLAVLAVFLLARVLFSAQVASYSALLFAINPYAIHYSQDARPYSLFLAAVAFSLFFTVKLLKRYDRRSAWGYIVSTLAALYSHPYGPFLIIVQLVAAFMIQPEAAVRPTADRKRLIGILGGVLLLYIPQMLRFGKPFLSKEEGFSRPFWIHAPTLQDFVVTLREYVMFGGLGVAIFLVIAIVGVRFLMRERRISREHVFLILFFLGFFLLPWIVSATLTPIYRPRYTISALIPLYIGLGWSLHLLSRNLRKVTLTILIALTAVPLVGFYSGIDKAPWREAAHYLRSDSAENAVILAHPWWTSRMLNYYLTEESDPKIQTVRSTQDLKAIIDRHSDVWLISSYQDNLFARDQVMKYFSLNNWQSSSVLINEHIRENPHAYWVAQIRVTRFTRAEREL